MARAERSKTFSARFSRQIVEKLDKQSARLEQSRARLAERIIDEGLRMEEFPGIIFRSGPTGRRAGVVGGPDVWEIVRDVKGAANAGSSDPIATVSEVSAIDRGKVELAARYYGAYPEDVDERIRINDEAAEHLRRALGDHRFA